MINLRVMSALQPRIPRRVAHHHRRSHQAAHDFAGALGHHLANKRAPARLVPELLGCSGFDAIYWSRHVISGSLALAFPVST